MVSKAIYCTRGNTQNGIRQGKMARWGFTE